jgi:MFS family permease
MTHASPQSSTVRASFLAVSFVTILASVGTGVLWNGLSFVAKHDYGFSKRQTMALYITVGGMYAIAAMLAGPMIRRLERHASVRTVLICNLLLMAMISPLLIVVKHPAMLWGVAVGSSILAALFWPIIESYLTAGRHGPMMRAIIGRWNIIWTLSVAGSMFYMAPMVGSEARLAISWLGVVYIAAILPVLWLPAHLPEHEEAQSIASVGREYPLLLRSARMLLPLSYVLNSALAPLLPYLFQRLQIEAQWETPTAATWMLARVLAMGVMWRLRFWHGWWGALLMGGTAMAVGFACTVAATGITMVLLGLALFGIGLGIIYYAAIYYALAVGRAAVDAGGTHEALIGLGYTIGPLIGLIALSASGQGRTEDLATTEGAWIIALVISVVILGGLGAVLPYRRARERRRVGA